MSNPTEQQLVANYMAAVAHLLGGRPGRHAEFIDKVDLIVSGSEPHALQLMQFGNRVRQSGRPVLWIHPSPEAPQVPQIGLVAFNGDQCLFFESCMLHLERGKSRATLIPDSFEFGAYRFDDQLRLRHLPKAPARSFDQATPAMTRAYSRLREIEAEQMQRGDAFPLPQLAKAA